MSTRKIDELAGFIWQVADLLRGDYKQSEYGGVILPFTVLRRLECVLEPTRDDVSATVERFKGKDLDLDPFLRKASGHRFYNTSKLTLTTILDDAEHAPRKLNNYVAAFSPSAREVLEKYKFADQVARLKEANLLYEVGGKFAGLDLRPEVVSNHDMGDVFEELIRRFSEQSNETAGEHFTPREIVRLMTKLLITPDKDLLQVPGTVRRILDPACGTGGILSAAEDLIMEHNPQATVKLYGQELNGEAWAICRSDLMIRDQDPSNIALGNSFSDDAHRGETFDYIVANPPFGVEWKKVKKAIEGEHEELGESGRFGAGLPRINDASLLFLQHMISKMKPEREGKGGSRIAIVFNGSPLFTGAAGSGESNIRKWIIENDWLEAVVALPDQMFYNTSISTYFWIVTNRKDKDHEGKVLLLDARDFWVKMRKSKGDKRKEVSIDQIGELTKLYGEAVYAAADEQHEHHGRVKLFKNEDFGYQRITVERPMKLRFELTEETLAALEETKPVQNLPGSARLIEALRPLLGSEWATKAAMTNALQQAVAEVGLTWPKGTPFAKALRDTVGVRDPEGEVQLKKGSAEPDPQLRDFENVPLGEDVEDYLKREVLPHVPDAWIDHEKTKIGYEIPFTRHFYTYQPPRPLEEIDAELKDLETQIQDLLGKVTQ